MHVLSTGAEPAADPLLMLTGGAGASAIGAFRELMLGPAGAAIRARRDIILFDQRGAGASTPSLKCPELGAMVAQQLGKPLSTEQQRALTAQALQQCHDRWVAAGVELSAYNSVESASDVAAVMKALGFGTYNIYALSYGTYLTQHVLRDHPEGIRGVTLDSTGPLERNILASAPKSGDRALRLLFSTCAADPACAQAYPGLEATTLQLMQTLAVTPATIQATHPTTGQPITWALTQEELIGGLLNSFSASSIPILPLLISSMTKGDFTPLNGLLPTWAQRDDSFADLREYTFRCTEAAGFSVDEVGQQGLYPPVAAFFTQVLEDIRDTCAAWALEPVDESALEPVRRDTPALVMSGQFDITTPPELGMQVHQNLANSFFIEFPATGHVVLGPCALGLLGAFLEDPAAKPDDACVRALELTFVTP
ncbi:alpha/beta fold hydrolase [Hyalangium gracile]|uniref:alpha/beta fold hydrolase n=1 Tax=Hyalangium gracile TaxID=394092 RepID=UPI001CCFA321|nr:alpha/beta fold hydrolase [Hyalangium gracile]